MKLMSWLFWEALESMKHDLHALKEGLQSNLKESRKMSAALDRLTSEVSEMKTVATSSAALIRKLAKLIRDNAEDPAALNALADDLDATEADLTAAVTENTPAEEPAQPEPEQPV